MKPRLEFSKGDVPGVRVTMNIVAAVLIGLSACTASIQSGPDTGKGGDGAPTGTGGSEQPQGGSGGSTDGSGGSGGSAGGSGGAVAPLLPSDIKITGAAADSVKPGPTRRLSNAELANAFQVLTGVNSAAVSSLPPDSNSYAFDRVVQGQTVIDRTLQGLDSMAEEAVTALTDAALTKWTAACAVKSALGTDGTALATKRRPCAEALLTTWAQTAYRRPLSSGEQQTLLALYDGAGTYRDGVNQLIRFVLQSPSFLYVIEQGTPDPKHPGVVALSDYEIAARLSLLFCETLPDATLLAAAAAGQLQDPAAVKVQAERLFNLPCAHTTIQRFYSQWLNLNSVASVMPDPNAFPAFNAKVRAGMQLEDKTFFEQMTWNNKASLGDVFKANYTYADQSLATIYGLTGLGTTAQKVTLPAERRGILTHPSILTITSHADRTSPVHRGVFVIRNLLCLTLGNPPPNVNVNLPPIDRTLTARQQFMALTQQGSCQTCHSEINPIGFGMEDFDGIGRHRTMDGTLPLDSNGSVPPIALGDFNGAAALSVALAERPELQLCFARKWLRFGLGRIEGQEDETSLNALVSIEKTGASLHDVMVGFTGTYAFTHRAAPPN